MKNIRRFVSKSTLPHEWLWLDFPLLQMLRERISNISPYFRMVLSTLLIKIAYCYRVHTKHYQWKELHATKGPDCIYLVVYRAFYYDIRLEDLRQLEGRYHLSVGGKKLFSCCKNTRIGKHYFVICLRLKYTLRNVPKWNNVIVVL